MRMLRVACCVLALFAAGSRVWADTVTATVTITNIGSIAGQTITVNATTRTWAATVTSGATQIQTGGSIAACASNLFIFYAMFPEANLYVATNGAATGVLYTGYPGRPPTVSLSAGWASLAYSTNYSTNLTIGRFPVPRTSPVEQTNVASGISEAINLSANTNLINSTKVYFQLLQTNFISGGLYTNTYGGPVQVGANVALTEAAVSGVSKMDLRILGAAGLGTTNTVSATTAGGTVAGTYTNWLSGFVPTNAVWTFTNTSSGAGNSATPAGGQLIVF